MMERQPHLLMEYHQRSSLHMDMKTHGFKSASRTVAHSKHVTSAALNGFWLLQSLWSRVPIQMQRSSGVWLTATLGVGS
jgi:hypothetical protein